MLSKEDVASCTTQKCQMYLPNAGDTQDLGKSGKSCSVCSGLCKYLLHGDSFQGKALPQRGDKSTSGI